MLDGYPGNRPSRRAVYLPLPIGAPFMNEVPPV